MPEAKPVVLQPGPELDALVWTAMGHDVVGWTTVVHVEGEDSVHSNSTPEGWACPAEHRPVYVECCQCDSMREDESLCDEAQAFGHFNSCLEAVPSFSTDPTAMMECWNWLDKQGYTVQTKSYPASYGYKKLAGKCELTCERWDFAKDKAEYYTVLGTTPTHALALMVVKVGAKLKGGTSGG